MILPIEAGRWVEGWASDFGGLTDTPDINTSNSGRWERRIAAATRARAADQTEMNGIHLVLIDMNNGIFGPYLAAIDRIFIPGRGRRRRPLVPTCIPLM
jgi:hypothetical protein